MQCLGLTSGRNVLVKSGHALKIRAKGLEKLLLDAEGRQNLILFGMV